MGVRVITAMFLRATLAASQQDEEVASKEKAKAREDYAHRIAMQIDKDGSGGLDEIEFAKLLDIPWMKDWVDDVGLSTSRAKRLFNALDTGDGEILFSDFVGALLRMRGSPRASDVVTILHESASMYGRICRIESTI